jgi:diguanylate cyclase (GGDEF)-like protein
MLSRENPAGAVRLEWATDLQSGLNRLIQRGCTAVLLNLDLSDSQGLETLHQLQRLNPECPIVVLGPASDGAIASRAIQAGAQDCLPKDQVTGPEILHAVRHAVDRKRYELALQRSAREMQALYETSLEINSQASLPALLKSLVERATRLLDLKMGGLYLMQPDGVSLKMEYVYNSAQDFTGIILQVGEGLAGRVAQTGSLLAVADYETWEGRAPAYQGATFRRTLAVPLKAGGKVIGVIDLSDNERCGEWSEAEIRLASLFADQAALAVQKARLLEAEREKSAELARSNAVIAALSQVAGQFSATLDPQQILETLGSQLKHLGVMVQLALFDNSPARLVVNYISADQQVVDLAETMLGQKIIGSAVPETVWPPAEQAADPKPVFLANPIPLLAGCFPETPHSVLEPALGRLNLTQHTPALLLPLHIKEHSLGVMLVWGSDLRCDDLPAFSIFANQVAVALENARLYNRIERQATLDELTGLYNRRGFFMLAEQQLRVAQRSGSELLLIFIDVDHLKVINDHLGHKEGDHALVQTAEALRATFRAADILARISGDEFVVLAYSAAGAGALERLRREAARINTHPPSPFSLSLSAGFVTWNPHYPITLDELLARADAQMYQVKRRRSTGDLNASNQPRSEGFT